MWWLARRAAAVRLDLSGVFAQLMCAASRSCIVRSLVFTEGPFLVGSAHARGRGQWVGKEAVALYVDNSAYALGNLRCDRRSLTAQQCVNLALGDTDGFGEGSYVE